MAIEEVRDNHPPPWRGGILAVKSQPRKLKGTGAFALPAPAISIKNKHLLLACATNPRFHGGCFGVWGTPPPKPLNCKSVSNRLGARLRSRWADPTGGTPWHSCALIRLALSDIIKTSRCYRSQTVHLSLLPFHRQFQENKKPCLTQVSRVKKFSFDSLPAYLQIIQSRFGALPAIRNG